MVENNEWYKKAKKELRRLRITHIQVAQELDCSQSAVTQKLNGTRGADISEIVKIASMIGMSIAELVEDDPTFARNGLEADLIAKFRDLNPDQKEIALKLLNTLKD